MEVEMVGGGGTNPGGRGGFSLPSGHGPLPSSGAAGAAEEESSDEDHAYVPEWLAEASSEEAKRRTAHLRDADGR